MVACVEFTAVFIATRAAVTLSTMVSGFILTNQTIHNSPQKMKLNILNLILSLLAMVAVCSIMGAAFFMDVEAGLYCLHLFVLTGICLVVLSMNTKYFER
jgi:surface polysaccharide O-acyltransferase-like enzyme